MNNNKKRTFRTTCIAPGCGMQSSKTELRFFKVPKDETKANIWFKILKLSLSDSKKKTNFICEQHFDPVFLGRNRLTKNAVPTLFTTNIVSCDIQQHPTSKKYYIENNNDVTFRNSTTNPSIIDSPPELSVIYLPSSKPILNKLEDAIIEEVTQHTTEDAWVPKNISTEVQTEDMCLDNEFLKFIDSYRCCDCDNFEKEDYSCLKCKSKEQLCQKYKLKMRNLTKLLIIYRKKINNLKKNHYNLKQKHYLVKSKNIGDMIDEQQVIIQKPTKYLPKVFFYKSASAYKYLKNVWNLRLPSESSIHKWSPIKYVAPGINDILMNQYFMKFEKMTETEKLCVMSFDEIRIRKDLVLNSISSKIEGFVDDGKKRSPEVADSALFFMLRGLKKKWKVPLNYFLVSNLKAEELHNIILDNIKLCNDILGVTVVMINCDQGANNIASYKKLQINIEQPFIILNGKKIFAQHDPPHLAKSLRNALEKHNIQHQDTGIASFEVIRKIYHHEKLKPLKLMPKISQQHMYPNDFQKMNVGLAKATISYTVACAIRTTLKTCPEIFGEHLHKAIPTAELIERFNNLNDCLDTKYVKHGSPYHQPLEVDNCVYFYLRNC